MQETWKKDACWIRIFLTNGVIGAPRRHGVKMILKWGVPLLRYSFLTNKMISSIFLIFPFFLFCPFIFFFLSFLSTQRKKENENLLRKFLNKEPSMWRFEKELLLTQTLFRVMGLTILSWRRFSSSKKDLILFYTHITHTHTHYYTLLSFFWKNQNIITVFSSLENGGTHPCNRTFTMQQPPSPKEHHKVNKKTTQKLIVIFTFSLFIYSFFFSFFLYFSFLLFGFSLLLRT